VPGTGSVYSETCREEWHTGEVNTHELQVEARVLKVLPTICVYIHLSTDSFNCIETYTQELSS
jgi:hypothetical protein